MTRSSNPHRFVAVALAAAWLAIAVPVAQAQSPDAFERAVNAQGSSPTFVGSPDAIDRALAARASERTFSALEARERALVERPARTTTVGPDAFERALVANTSIRTAEIASTLDRKEPSRVSPATAGTTASGFDWSDFGMGAGAGVGLMLVLLGLGAGVLALRRGHSRVTTA